MKTFNLNFHYDPNNNDPLQMITYTSCNSKVRQFEFPVSSNSIKQIAKVVRATLTLFPLESVSQYPDLSVKVHYEKWGNIDFIQYSGQFHSHIDIDITDEFQDYLDYTYDGTDQTKFKILLEFVSSDKNNNINYGGPYFNPYEAYINVEYLYRSEYNKNGKTLSFL